MAKPIDILNIFNKSMEDEAEKSVVEVEVEPDDVHLEEGKEGIEKAITSQSIPYLSSYTQRSLFERATMPITRANSRLTAPEGRAPFLASAVTHSHGEDYENCASHGTTFKSTSHCSMCAMMKSFSCNKCGGDLMKTPGGGSVCKKCEG